jgi:spermidine/putrescine-binding protein
MIKSLFSRWLLLFVCLCSADCNRQDPTTEKVLNVYIWSEYLPQSVIDDFTGKTGIKVNVSLFSKNEELLAKLQSGSADFDVVVPSDYMVHRLIKQKLVKPLDRSKLKGLENLDPNFLNQQFDPGNQYSLPYFWGTTGIAYNKKEVKEPVESWAILFDHKYERKVLMLDDARECFAAALRAIGKDANATDPASLEQAAAKLKEQKHLNLVQAYDSDAFHEKLAARDVILAQGYGGQFAKVIRDKPDELAYVIPREGGTRWTDNLCVPATARRTESVYAFLNYVLRPEVAAKIANEVSYATPNATARKLVDKGLLDDPAVYPPDDVLRRCQFMQDLGDAARVVERHFGEVKAQ